MSAALRQLRVGHELLNDQSLLRGGGLSSEWPAHLSCRPSCENDVSVVDRVVMCGMSKRLKPAVASGSVAEQSGERCFGGLPMRANKGDHLMVDGRKVGDQTREGEIVEVRGQGWRATLRGAVERRSRGADLSGPDAHVRRRSRARDSTAAEHAGCALPWVGPVSSDAHTHGSGRPARTRDQWRPDAWAHAERWDGRSFVPKLEEPRATGRPRGPVVERHVTHTSHKVCSQSGRLTTRPGRSSGT